MSDTPETDAVAEKLNFVVDFDFARKLERERDEARERIERQKLEINRLNGATNHAGETPLKIALRKRDEWAAMCGRYKQERDEALEQAQRLRVQLNHYSQVNEMAELAFRERDEARKIAERAIDDLAWFNERNAQRLRNELEQLKEETK